MPKLALRTALWFLVCILLTGEVVSADSGGNGIDKPLHIPLVSSPADGSLIVIESGWSAAALVDTGRTLQMSCISFRNTGQKTATLIRFRFTTISANGDTIDSLYLDRRGSFAAGTLIDGPHHPDQPGGPIKARNCVLRKVPKEILSAQKVLARIDFVRYADGSEWSGDASPK